MLSTQSFSSNSLQFFPDKIPLNLNRCPVKIVTGIWPPNVINITSVDEAGIEMEFIKAMESHLNCNLSVHIDEELDMGLKFDENEEPTGRMGLLKVYAIYMNIYSTKSLHVSIKLQFRKRNTIYFLGLCQLHRMFLRILIRLIAFYQIN